MKTIFSILFFTQIIFSQNKFQFSSSDFRTSGNFFNPAILGIESGNEFLYHTNYQKKKFSEHIIIAKTQMFAGSYAKITGEKFDGNTYSYGLGIGDRMFSLGFSQEFFIEKDKETYMNNLGFIFCPTENFSFSYMNRFSKENEVKILNEFGLKDKEQILGIGIRPMDEDFTLFIDAKSNSRKIYDSVNFSVGANLKLTNGIYFNSSYHKILDKNFFSIGFQFDFPNSSVYTHSSFGKENFPTQSFSLRLTDKIQKSNFNRELIAEIEIEGNYNDYSSFGIFSDEKSLHSLIEQFDKIANDDEIKGVLIRIKPFSTSYAIFGMNGSLEELRRAIERVKQSGKKVVAYLENVASLQEIYIVSCCDKIVMPQYGFLLGYGINFNSIKYKYALKKFGIDVRTYTAGKYKSALNEMSDTLSEWKIEELNKIADDLYEEISSHIKSKREKISQNAIDLLSGIMDVKTAKENFIIDEIGFYEDAKKVIYDLVIENCEINCSNCKEYETISMKNREYQNYRWGEKIQIAVIGIYGGITKGKSQEEIPIPLIGQEKTTGSETIIKQFEDAMNNENIKAIILRVDSPGGDGMASDDIYRIVQKAREKKLVVISMGSLAASGGYYVSSTGAKIFANPTTLTASIGVISQIPFLNEIFDSLDIYQKNFSRGKFSNFLNPYEKPSNEGEKMLINTIEIFYDGFLDRICEGRKIEKSYLQEIAQGRIWTGRSAKEKKLIDEFGGLYEAIQYAKSELKVENCEVKFYPTQYFALEEIFSTTIKSLQKISLQNLLEKERIKIQF